MQWTCDPRQRAFSVSALLEASGVALQLLGMGLQRTKERNEVRQPHMRCMPKGPAVACLAVSQMKRMPVKTKTPIVCQPGACRNTASEGSRWTARSATAQVVKNAPTAKLGKTAYTA
jgi:hypothetical protein